MKWVLFALQVWGVVLVIAATVLRVSVLRMWAEPGRTTRWFVWISPAVLAVAAIVWLAAG